MWETNVTNILKLIAFPVVAMMFTWITVEFLTGWIKGKKALKVLAFFAVNILLLYGLQRLGWWIVPAANTLELQIIASLVVSLMGTGIASKQHKKVKKAIPWMSDPS